MPKIQAFHSTLHQNRQSELHHSMEPVLQIHHPTWTFPEAVPADTSVFIYIQIMLFGHFNHCIDHGTGVSSFRCIAEQPVTASNRKRSDCIFAEVIGKTAPSILEIGHEFSLVVLGIVHRFLKTGSPFWSLLWEPVPECIKHRLFLFKAVRISLCSYVYFLDAEYLSCSNSLFMYWTPCAAGLL